MICSTLEEYELRLSLASDRERPNILPPRMRLTASSYGLARKCVYPWTSGLRWDTSANPSARLGTAFHRYAEMEGRIAVQGLIQKYNLTSALARRLTAMTSHWDTWAKDTQYFQRQRLVEFKFALDPETLDCQVLWSPCMRDYSEAPDGWVAGTVDLIQDGIITDYKTGYTMNPWQLVLLELMVCCATGWRRAETRFEKFTEEGHRSLPVQGPAPLQTAKELLTITRRIKERDTTPTPSFEACRFCPVRDQCPSRMEEPRAAITWRE